MGKVKAVTDNDFTKNVIESPIPVLVDFWAPWCGPCQIMAPIMDSIAEEYEGKINVVKLNVDENPSTTAKYGIRGIPTLILFYKGQESERIIGAQSKTVIEEMIKRVI